ncbi:molybdate ABC transporter substrate-binding protein [Vibrio sp. 10N.286.49.B3]|uniref:molybdate ABC transporter substrate-binding protein n=1 Tax=Vibrio sp. 10N.286.49.B3 TaxID=1880855 RepID=UPI000C83F647|nr:molybdate ABC transporter substrate-binding protein [Vibrio sp. 10N.286.49.B3]
MKKILLISALCVFPVHANVLVAVANNFYLPSQKLVEAFEKKTGEKVEISTGSTGQLYAQIKNGAPFDIFLAADQARPKALHDEGLSFEPKTYAQGVLVLWSPQADLVDSQGDVLAGEDYTYIAVADPKLAPYGAAAMEALDHMGVQEAVTSRQVVGKGLNATYQYVDSGNAQLGFLAYSQVIAKVKQNQGSFWKVPEDYYRPILQDAVLIKTAADNSQAVAFMDYLYSDEGRKLISDYGYSVQ